MLFTLALPVACISWTVTHEEVFQELREHFIFRKRTGKHFLERKFFYLFTCEYCFSHYVAAFIVAITRFQLGARGWAGYVVAFFALVWVANHYMTLYNTLRLQLQRKRVQNNAEPEADSATLGWFRLVHQGGSKSGRVEEPFRPEVRKPRA